jgi:hypothetical protein
MKKLITLVMLNLKLGQISITIFKYHVSAPMRRLQLELIYYFTSFPPLSHPKFVFLSSKPFVVNTTFSTGLVKKLQHPQDLIKMLF